METVSHNYRLVFRSSSSCWPFSDEKIRFLDLFQEKYQALLTANERLRRGTFHFRSDAKLTLETLKKDFPTFNILDFYEVH